MRRLRALLLGGVLAAGALGGPAVAAVSALVSSPVATYAGWTCHSDGSGTNGSTTTLSTAALYSDPHDDWISCLFRDYAPKGVFDIQFGGDCYFDIPGSRLTQVGRIEFAHRTWLVQNGSAKLTCWDGSFIGD